MEEEGKKGRCQNPTRPTTSHEFRLRRMPLNLLPPVRYNLPSSGLSFFLLHYHLADTRPKKTPSTWHTEVEFFKIWRIQACRKTCSHYTAGASEDYNSHMSHPLTTIFTKHDRALRMARSKPPPARPKFSLFVRYTFKTQSSSISPREVSAIEHLLRKGKRQIEMYEDPQVRDCWVSQAMRDWEISHKEGRRTSTAKA